MKEKTLKILIFIYVCIICIISIMTIFEPLMYDENSKGKNIDNEKIYDISHSIISQKYEAILYNEYENIYDLFSFLSKSKLRSFYQSYNYNKIINEFKDFKIINIEKANINKYIIYYYEIYNSEYIQECKMVIKYKNDKAVIFYDTLLEENNE